jgi:putative ABC transport system permease protein
MSTSIYDIPLQNFGYLIILAVPVIYILFRWKLGAGKGVYALIRMLLQLLAVGYVLAFIFESENAALVLGVLTIMLVAASWISLNPLKNPSAPLYLNAFIAIFFSGVFILFVVTQGVLQVRPWYAPRMMIPLGG